MTDGISYLLAEGDPNVRLLTARYLRAIPAEEAELLRQQIFTVNSLHLNSPF